MKRVIEDWVCSTKFKFYATHKNNVGTPTDAKEHGHVWHTKITGRCTNLDKNSISFNFKTIASFVFETLNCKNMNDVLEHKDRYIDRKYLSQLWDITTEPSNEMISKLIAKLAYAKILCESNGEMSNIEMSVEFDKVDNIKENDMVKFVKLPLTAETSVKYSFKVIGD